MSDGCGSDCILENQIPSYDPGKKLAQGRVSVGISGTCDRSHRGEFRITKRRENAGDSSDQKRKSKSRAGRIVCSEAG